MAPKNTESPGTASSPTVVGVELKAALNGAIYARDVTEVKTPTTKISALNGVTVLNGRVSVVTAESLRVERETANKDKNTALALQAKPTADYLRKKSTGMKDGRKMIIKVDPPAENEDVSKPVPGLVFDKFSLQAVTESDEERYQLHETFAEEVLFVFGRRPRIWTLAGIVVNSDDANYADELIGNYDLYYRGTRVVDKQMRTFIFYEDVLIEGTLLGLTVSRNGQIPGAVNASITLVVHERGLIGQTADDISDENLAAFLERAQASLTGEKIEPDQIRDPKPDSATVEKQAAQTSGVEVTANAKVAELEKQIGDSTASFDKAFEENAAAEEQWNQAIADEASATTPEAAAAAADKKDAAKKEILRTESAMQEAAENIVNLEQQIEDEKESLSNAAAKGDAQSATAKGAAAAEGATGEQTVIVDVAGQAVADSTLVEGQTVYGVSVTVKNSGQPAVTLRGGGDSQNVYESPDELISRMTSVYGIVINRSGLTAGIVVNFSGKTEGRLL